MTHQYFTLVNVYVDVVVLRVLPVLHKPEMVDIGVNTISKNMPYASRTIDFNHF